MRKFILLSTILFTFSAVCYSQALPEDQNTYRRSSLCTILMDDVDMVKREEILKAFVATPIPDKFNNHNIEGRIFDPKRVRMSAEEREAYDELQRQDCQTIEELLAREDKATVEDAPVGDASVEAAPVEEAPVKKKGGFMKTLSSVGKIAGGVTGTSSASNKNTSKGKSAIFDASKSIDFSGITAEYMLEQAVSKQLFDKWFLCDEGNFTMDLVKERGKYDASAIDVMTAKNSELGMGLLEDAGEELINNTFVVASRYRYVSKDDLVNEIHSVVEAVAEASGSQYAVMGAAAAKIALNASMGAGYYVYITSFLFQLDWNEEIAHTFYANLWGNKDAYQAADIFSLKLVGEEKAFANVKAGIFTDKNETELVRIATINATDAVLAKLEKKYDVFKTKTPLYSAEPLTAHIGMKEGVAAGDKYEVLEQVVDENTNKTKYVRKTVLTVAKNGVWDNRYMADEEAKLAGKEQLLTATKFEGNAKGLYPGMLLRQIKK